MSRYVSVPYMEVSDAEERVLTDRRKQLVNRNGRGFRVVQPQLLLSR